MDEQLPADTQHFGDVDKGQRDSTIPQVEYNPEEITDEAMHQQWDDYYNAKYGTEETPPVE